MNRLTIGIIIGLVLGLSTQVFAEEVVTEVKAVFAKMNFYVNGEEKVLEADPLIYQGSTYLPVRVVSNLLGYDVTYKADTRTIELDILVNDSYIQETSGGEVSLEDVPLLESQLSQRKELLRYAEEKLVRDEAKMVESKAFYEEHFPNEIYESTDPRSIYQRNVELINADKAKVIALKAEIEALEAQLVQLKTE